MTEPATITYQSALGVETTPGTAVAATRQLQSMKIKPKVEFTTEFFRPSGIKFPTNSLPGKEWASASMDAVPTYDELPYMFASLIGQPDSITDLGGGAYEWFWDVSSSDESPPQTYTFEVGNVGSEQVMAHSWINQMDLSVSNDRKTSISGSLVGQSLEELGSFATGLLEAVSQPILGSQFCLYMDDSAATLGTTKMNRAFNIKLGFPPRRAPVWTIDCDEPSFVSLVEIEGGEPMATIMVAADSQGEDLLAKARSAESKFIQIHAEGADINGTDNHYLEINLAAKIESVGAEDDTSGVQSRQYGLRGVHDGTWGKSHTVKVVTNLASL